MTVVKGQRSDQYGETTIYGRKRCRKCGSSVFSFRDYPGYIAQKNIGF
jgi:hypothetical protein